MSLRRSLPGTARTAARIVVVALRVVRPAHAPTGGPITVEVLGWNAADERIYVRQLGHDESGGKRSCVYYFKRLDSRNGVLPWPPKH